MKRKAFLKKSLMVLPTILVPSWVLGKTSANEFPNSITKSNQAMPEELKFVLHKANTRGHADHGWLKAYHTFSFANYQDRNRMNFGLLRVLNDDTVAGGKGFGKHPHDNMEIITIPLEGALAHEDSMGNSAIIRHGDVQVMSAGSGVYHSEFNASKLEPVKLLQIWVFSDRKNVSPRYDQMTLKPEDRKNKLQTVVSPHPGGEGLWIYQKAWFHLAELQSGKELSYTLKQKGNGVYVFLIDGKMTIAGQDLDKRDGLGVWNTNSFNIKAKQDSYVLLMEVPMA